MKIFTRRTRSETENCISIHQHLRALGKNHWIFVESDTGVFVYYGEWRRVGAAFRLRWKNRHRAYRGRRKKFANHKFKGNLICFRWKRRITEASKVGCCWVTARVKFLNSVYWFLSLVDRNRNEKLFVWKLKMKNWFCASFEENLRSQRFRLSTNDSKVLFSCGRLSENNLFLKRYFPWENFSENFLASFAREQKF